MPYTPEQKHEWYLRNKKSHLSKCKLWRQTHLKQYDTKHREWARNNPDKVRETGRKTRKKHHYKTNLEVRKRHEAKRERGLGFIVLWKPEIEIELMQYHHIDPIFVVRIPKRIHDSVFHNVWTGNNMDAINELALEYIINTPLR